MPGYIQFDPKPIQRVPGAIRKTRESIARLHREVFNELGQMMVPELAARTPVSTRRLQYSTYYELSQANADAKGAKGVETRLSICQFALNVHGTPVSNYARFAALGRGPGRAPPIIALLDWVLLRFGVVRLTPRRRLAFLVARKIARVGSWRWRRRDIPYPTQTVLENEQRIQAAVDKLGAQVVVSLTDVHRAPVLTP